MCVPGSKRQQRQGPSLRAAALPLPPVSMGSWELGDWETPQHFQGKGRRVRGLRHVLEQILAFSTAGIAEKGGENGKSTEIVDQFLVRNGKIF